MQRITFYDLPETLEAFKVMAEAKQDHPSVRLLSLFLLFAFIRKIKSFPWICLTF